MTYLEELKGELYDVDFLNQDNRSEKPEWDLYLYRSDIIKLGQDLSVGDQHYREAMEAAKNILNETATNEVVDDIYKNVLDSVTRCTETMAIDAAWHESGGADDEIYEHSAFWAQSKLSAIQVAIDAARDAMLLVYCALAWNDPEEVNTIYAYKRWDVWKNGFGLFADVNGTFHVYRLPHKLVY